MKLRSFYLLVAAIFMTCSLSAQSAKVDRAKQYMKDLNYTGAIELLSQVVAKGDNDDAKIALAECYRKINDSENAEFLYSQVVRLQTAQPIHFLYYGEMLQRNGKCDLAREWFKKFAEAVPEDVRGQYQNRACDYEKELKTKGNGVYDISHTAFNSNLDDFGATFYKDDKRGQGIIFASERDKGVAVKRSHNWTGNPFLDLYFVPTKGCGTTVETGKPEKFSSDINSKYHDAVVTFNKDQSQIFFTRNNLSKGKIGHDDQGIVRLKIYTDKRSGSGWKGEESLPFNSDEYSCAHPSLNAEGNKLYFASDMPGGFGGMDLYVSELENGRWGPAMNLGPTVNTEGNELFPFIHKSGRLYFASDGQLGLGGLDIYSVDPKDGGQWTAPDNVGAPINSKDDDFGLTLSDDGTCGFFSSDRQGGAGRDDIYSFTKKATPVKVFVFDELTKEPIEGAEVTSDSCMKRTLKTGKDGKVTVDVKFNSCCTFKASFAGYDKNSKPGCVKDAASVENAVVEIPLRKEQKFMVEGIVFDQSTGLPLPDSKISFLGDCKDSVQTFMTDATGKFKFKMANDCCYKLRGEKDKYFAVTTQDTICSRNQKESKIYQVNLNLQPTTAPTGAPATVTDAGGNNTNRNGDNTPGSIAALNPSGTNNPSNINPGMVTGGTKIKHPKGSVYKDEETGMYMKNGKLFNGTKDGIAYKDGTMVDDPNTKVFIPSDTRYTVGDSAQAYLLHIYYDFDQSYIRDESTPQLNKLLGLIKDNPNYIIEISSHTDARGSDSYNKRLSQRRAESVVRWLIEHGVERDKLVPRGYGESIPTNKCVNAIPCSEREHQMNRRTEFRVLGCRDCVDDAKKKLSRPNEKAHVDKCNGCPF